jgi:hypothetical protein
VSPQLVYAAHPITSYGTPHERRSLARLRRLLPRATVIDPATRYRTPFDWEEDWPGLVGDLAGFVVFGAEDGTIGAGCLKELADAIACRVPVATLAEGGLREVDSVTFLSASLLTPSRTATLTAGALLQNFGPYRQPLRSAG